MKKIMLLVMLSLCLFMMTSCDLNKEEKQTVTSYSVYGENEFFVISDGEFTIDNEEAVFDAGEIEFKDKQAFAGLKSYALSVYLLDGEEKNVIVGRKVEAPSGILVIGDEIGDIEGEEVLKSKGLSLENIDNIKENLWFELNITNGNDEKSEYKLKLELIEDYD